MIKRWLDDADIPWLFLAVLGGVVALVLLFASCAPPPQAMSFRQWAATHAKVIVTDRAHDAYLIGLLKGHSGGYDPVANMAVIDLDKYRGNPVGLAETEIHEPAHALDRAYDGAYSMMMPSKVWTIANEQAAQCILHVVLGHEPITQAPADVARGYWGCDDLVLLAQVKAKMLSEGIAA